jgi:hypothetical protein
LQARLTEVTEELDAACETKGQEAETSERCVVAAVPREPGSTRDSVGEIVVTTIGMSDRLAPAGTDATLEANDLLYASGLF